MMRINFQSKVSALMMGVALLVASCGGSGDSDNAKTIERALGSLSQALAVETEAPAHQKTHSRFIKRMQAADANNKPVNATAHLDALMWHVGDLRKHSAIPDEYAVPLNTALHYVAQLYGTGRAEKARQLGDPPVTAAQFESAVAQLRALVAATGQGGTPREAAMLVTETSTGCKTMGEIGEDVGVVLAALAHTYHGVAGGMAAAMIDIWWPIDCADKGTEALQDQLNELNLSIDATTLSIYTNAFSDLKQVATVYSTTINSTSDGPSRLSDLRLALQMYQTKRDTLRANGNLIRNLPQLARPMSQ